MKSLAFLVIFKERFEFADKPSSVWYGHLSTSVVANAL